MDISLSVDVERDCPPMLSTSRGIQQGIPRLLELFEESGIRATFFISAELCREYADIIKNIVEGGHEIGCHGYAHERFDRLGYSESYRVISKATGILRKFSEDVKCFRAPNLKFPEKYLHILEDNGYSVDSSLAAYKPPFRSGIFSEGGIVRVCVSMTSSALRLPMWLVKPLLGLYSKPVLFVHPWEFVDMSKENIRFDCKFNTGEKAVENLRRIIYHLKSRGYIFKTVSEIAGI